MRKLQRYCPKRRKARAHRSGFPLAMYPPPGTRPNLKSLLRHGIGCASSGRGDWDAAQVVGAPQNAIIIHAKDASVWRVEHPLFDIPAPGSIGANIQRRFPNNPDTFAHTPCHNPLHTSKQNQTLKSTKLLKAPCV